MGLPPQYNNFVPKRPPHGSAVVVVGVVVVVVVVLVVEGAGNTNPIRDSSGLKEEIQINPLLEGFGFTNHPIVAS